MMFRYNDSTTVTGSQKTVAGLGDVDDQPHVQNGRHRQHRHDDLSQGQGVAA